MTDYIKTTNSKRNGIYHTDESCDRIAQMSNYNPVSDEIIELYDMTECKFCAGEFENINGGDEWHTINAKLKNAEL